MTKFRDYSNYLLGLKCVQLLISSLVLMCESIQLISYSQNVVPYDNNSNEIKDDINDDGSIKKFWVITVCCSTILSNVLYAFNFKKIWNKGPFFWLECLFFAFWLSAALVNISPVYRGLGLFNCKLPNDGGLDVTTVCHAWIASLVLSWIVFVICSIVMVFTLRISRERVKTGIDLTSLPSPKSPKSYLEKYEKKLAELEQHELPAPQVITIPEIVQISAELEQDVPQQTQLLLQSGLPDQGIPLQIVLPQSNFHITSEEFENENDKNEHQEESQTSHEVAPQVISITLSKDGEDSTNYTDSTDSTDSNFLIIPSQPKSETSSLHEVPL